MNEQVVPPSREVRDEAFWRGGGDFRWCVPKLDWGLRAADPITRLMWNRYPHIIIGAALYVRGWGAGVRWKTNSKRKRRAAS